MLNRHLNLSERRRAKNPLRGCESSVEAPDSVAELAQNCLRAQQAVLGGFVVSRLNRVFAFLIELPRLEKLLAFRGFGGTNIAHVRQFERDLPFELDQILRWRCRVRRVRDSDQDESGADERKCSRAEFHCEPILFQAEQHFQRHPA